MESAALYKILISFLDWFPSPFYDPVFHVHISMSFSVPFTVLPVLARLLRHTKNGIFINGNGNTKASMVSSGLCVKLERLCVALFDLVFEN